MTQIIVVENKKAFPLTIPGVEVVSARDYLTSTRFTDEKRLRVFNLCRTQGYQTLGYYVSLLAEARAHKHIPSLSTIRDLRQSAILKIAAEDLEDLIEKNLHSLKSDEFVLSIYFGRNLAQKYDRLCQALFNHFPAPLLRARFVRQGKSFRLADLKPTSVSEVPEAHQEFLTERVLAYFKRARQRGEQVHRYDLAILVNPEEENAPSTPKTIERFVKAARQVGMNAFVVGREEYGRIGEYDALFIRETTGVNHHTYRFASRAQKEGLVVIDSPEAILKCCNKVYQAEAFERKNIPCPRTMIVHSSNRRDVEDVLGLPCVLKQPDSSFSQGVVKASTSEELQAHLDRLLERSPLIIAQSFTPSEFDWRVGVLGGEVIYVCRYFMVKGHWQIQQEGEGGKKKYGRHETLRVEDAPEAVVELARAAAAAVGPPSLYGIDIKESNGRFYVIEVNDNPNLDVGVEDLILKDELYLKIMRYFRARLEERGRSTP